MLFKNEVDTPNDGMHINTAALYNAVVNLILDAVLNAAVNPGEICAVCVSGHGNGLYIIGEHGILPYAYSSMYVESQKYVPDTKDTFPFTIQTAWSGQPLSILSLLKSEEPTVFSKIRKVLFCKDIIKYILTGRICTDYTDASAAGMLNYKTGRYDTELLKLYGLENYSDILPELCRSTEIIGGVSEKIAKRTGLLPDTPVIGGLFDVNSCMLGAGVIKPDKYCIISGTWGINSVVVEKPTESDKITQCCNFCFPDKFMCIDSAPTSCTNLEWFLKKVMRDITCDEADNIVEQQPINQVLFYFPYIYKPMDMNISGGFRGITFEHDYRDLMRAVFEGIVFDHAYRIEKLKSIGIVYDSAVLTGGAANSKVLCQMFADCMGINIYTTIQPQTGTLGSAIAGAVAVGIYPDIDTAAENMVKIKNCYQPSSDQKLRQKFEIFKKHLKAQQYEV